MNGILLVQRTFTYHGNLPSKSRACKIANQASRCGVRFRITQLIWAPSRVTVQILGPSRITERPFATLKENLRSFLHYGGLQGTHAFFIATY